MAALLQTPIQFFSEGQGQETVKDMASDCLISLVEYRPGIQNDLDLSEDLLDLQEFLKLERYSICRKIGIGLQSPFFVKPSLPIDFVMVQGSKNPSVCRAKNS